MTTAIQTPKHQSVAQRVLGNQQKARMGQSRDLELSTALHIYDRPGRYTVTVKVIDIFCNDTMTLVPVNVE